MPTKYYVILSFLWKVFQQNISVWYDISHALEKKDSSNIFHNQSTINTFVCDITYNE